MTRVVVEATSLVGRRTGIGSYTAHLVAELPAALARAGLDAQVDVTTWTARGGRLTDLPAGVRQVGPRLPARLLRAAWLRWDQPKAEALVGACDVVHGTNFVSPPTTKAREVVSVHDLTYELFAETVSTDSLDYRTLVRRAVRRGAQVLCLTDAVNQTVRSFYGLPASQVSTVRPGVAAVWFDQAPPGPDLRHRLDLPDDYVVFVGSLDPRKNLPRLIAAHAAARTVDPTVPDLVLAGPAGRATDLDAGAHVLRTGWLADADLRAVVAGARALALPSLDEGFGLPALEALACGRPVLAADIPALHEVTGDLAVFAEPTDTDALRDGLLEVLDSGDDPRRQVHAREWTWARCADEAVRAYGVV